MEKLGIGGILALVFLILKLCEVIDWSWWWVLCPVWIPVVIELICWLILIFLHRRR